MSSDNTSKVKILDRNKTWGGGRGGVHVWAKPMWYRWSAIARAWLDPIPANPTSHIKQPPAAQIEQRQAGLQTVGKAKLLNRQEDTAQRNTQRERERDIDGKRDERSAYGEYQRYTQWYYNSKVQRWCESVKVLSSCIGILKKKGILAKIVRGSPHLFS